jgi:CBS-domain-containing membrane protein
MIVSDVMTREVASVRPEAELKDAVFLMMDRKLSGLPVVDKDGQVVGMITEGDLLRRAEIGTQGEEPGWFELLFTPGSAAFDYVRTHSRKVGMLMSANVVSIAPTAELAEAARLMRKLGLKRLPVIEDGRLVGILARADLLRALAGALESCVPVSDSELLSRISTELKEQGWAPKANVHVSVDDGVVELSGLVTDMRQRDALCALAESAGARQVHNRMLCVEPISATQID